MARKTKTPAPKLPVPQSDQDAEAAIARIGELTRELERIQADANDRIAEVTSAAGEKARPVNGEIRAQVEGLRTFCEAHRARLTGNFVRKTAAFATGTVAWRARPAKVTLRDKVEDILARLKTLGLQRFVRTKEEVDKEAMLKEAAIAATVAGVSVGSAGEDFVVEPLQAALEAVP